ncbi:MAG: transcriptional repressor [Gemmatimonadaceae bacterium]|nr:transcriptional repressor [Acetobacteraceae bacterium]
MPTPVALSGRRAARISGVGAATERVSVKDSTTVAIRLETAAAACLRDGVRFTDLRRHVLGLILAADGPVTAYGLLDHLRSTRWNAAPPTVYRALDFLLQQGLIHRIERLNAFIGCDEGASHDHAAQFLICRTCGAVDEFDGHAVADAVGKAAAAKGFTPAHATIEIEGTCAACTAAVPG